MESLTAPTALSERRVVCRACGAVSSITSGHCGRCGAGRARHPPQQRQEKTQIKRTKGARRKKIYEK